ncbi:helix-turn-helix transcriptional regulator [Dactylosporangium sp. AC04546]|uniref:helix-turn-helix domain-containing protein n=1 Tax=Dactylosporangium sp. AC04546 TaxID=2862460 RepID=UPI001EE0CEC7|nr:helix-turn-helix transcriptional regulator [Dactylosporangium sp. AC04546]WVK83472.1 helix-turn-helix transcriptional regulator [Dactylosporangium sp. AC04546]
MSLGDTPAVARRRVRLAIRDARNAKGYTQGQVADAMDWSLSKVMRIESGEVTISQNDLRPLLNYLGIRDRAVVESLVQSAKASKQRRQWWDEPRFQGMLTPAMRQLIGFEAEATVIRHFYPMFFPGVLQTREYARGIMEQYSHELTPKEMDARIEARIRRKQGLLQRQPRPRIFTLLDASVLLRTNGIGDNNLGKQLTEVTEAIKDGWLAARIYPFDKPHPGIGTFEILYLEAEDLTHAVLYRESLVLDEIVEEAPRIQQHRALWDRMWSAAISDARSAEMISARAEELNGSDR